MGPYSLMDKDKEEAVEELRKYLDVILQSSKLCLKASKSNANKNVYLKKIFNPCIPVLTPWVWVMVCLDVPKFTTIPIPMSPILETPQVYPHLF